MSIDWKGNPRSVRDSTLVGALGYFEDFAVGQRMRHARGATIGEVENSYLSKAVMNTAQGHWNEDAQRGSALGDGRLVFGLITGSMVVGLTTQDTAEQMIAEIGLDKVRFQSPVHHGDTVYAYSEVIATDDVPDRRDAGIVRFRHWGVTSEGRVVVEMERTVLIRRRPGSP